MKNEVRGVCAGLLALGLLALGGCASEVGSPADDVAAASIERIDARTFDALADGVDVWLDLRSPSAAYTVDTDDVPLERVALVCPNGQVMRWEDWVASDAALVERARGVVGISNDPRLAELAGIGEDDGGCALDCYACKDGATLCHPDWECLGAAGLEVGDVENVGEQELWRHLWVEGALPPGSDPTPPGEGSETGSGGDVPDPTPSGGSDDSGGSSGAGGSSGGGSGGYDSGGSGGSSPGGHPGWG